MDFIYLLKGECNLIFEVTKIFDKETDNKVNLNNKELNEEFRLIQTLGSKLREKLITPYFQTEVEEQ